MSAALALIEHKQRLLFLKRSVLTSRPGQWCLPGGRINANETPEEACIREVFEEAALKVKVRQLVLQSAQSYYFNCELLSEAVVRLNPRESSRFAWVDPLKLLKLGYIMDFRTVIPLLKDLGYPV